MSSVPLSETLRSASTAAHEGARSQGFMQALFDGAVPMSSYARYLVQLQPVYAALEHGRGQVDDDRLTSLLDPALDRSTAITADLDVLRAAGAQVPSAPSDVALVYAARITRCALEWPVGFLAHHYTRYLGDLSGGLAIGGVVRRTYGLAADRGASFYVFEGVHPGRFKQAYRACLDGLRLDDGEVAAMAEEVLAAYEHNVALVEDLTTTGTTTGTTGTSTSVPSQPAVAPVPARA
ncbi:heme oxygenase (biliverdin-producing) [Aquipuribacter sp. MA13-6]|uniref:biliverdin-producing heme oxygenase n=1 Tax=unclassified Aquipuribacter TaxID=2635084 RepID=UPI003EEDC4D7